MYVVKARSIVCVYFCSKQLRSDKTKANLTVVNCTRVLTVAQLGCAIPRAEVANARVAPRAP